MRVAERPPVVEFAFPGPLRDRLVAAILSGEKTATTGLVIEWELDGDPLPRPGARFTVIDSGERPVGVIEIRAVEVKALADVDLRVAIDEGEGFTSVAEWRAAHEDFWNGYADEVRGRLGDDEWSVSDETRVLVQWFTLIERTSDP